jgi:outer membrane protein assembly factor BamB
VCCGGVTAINPQTSAILWKAEAKSQVIGSVALARGVVFYGDSKGNLTALAGADGKVVWHQDLDASIQAGVTIADGRVFVGTARGNPAFPPSRVIKAG